MLDDETIRFLHSGCALLVGSVDADGLPHAGRALGLTVVERGAGHGADKPRVRLLLDGDDVRTLANLGPGAAVAITAASVPTLRSIQMKGSVVSVEPADEADAAKQAQYTADFIRDIHETDGDPIDLLRRWSDHPAVACVVDVDASFDQTPGPSAGCQVRSAAT